MVAVGIQGFHRYRVNRIPSDEGLDVFDITVVRVLCARAGPEQPLVASALSSQLHKPVATEDLFVDLISHLRAGDGCLPTRFFCSLRLLAALCNNFFQQWIHQRVNPTYRSEERRVGKECRSRW